MMTAYDDSMRTIIEVPDEMIESLDRVVGREGRSRAALIREAIGEYLRKKSLPPAEAAFGLWGGGAKDGLAYQDELRGEWER